MPTQNDSINLQKTLRFICMPKIHLMIHFLLKEAYTWVQVLLNVVAQQWQPVHHCTKIQVIILNHFHEKLMKRSFKKSTKPHFGAMLGPSAQIWEKMNFHEKKGWVSFKYSNYLLWCKKQRKLMSDSWRKMLNWQRNNNFINSL